MTETLYSLLVKQAAKDMSLPLAKHCVNWQFAHWHNRILPNIPY